MKTPEILQLMTALLTAAASIIMSLEQKLVKRLRRQNATSPEAAVPLPNLRAISRWRLTRLQTAGAVRGAGTDAYYFHEESYRALRRKRVRRAVTVALVIAAAATAVYFLR